MHAFQAYLDAYPLARLALLAGCLLLGLWAVDGLTQTWTKQ